MIPPEAIEETPQGATAFARHFFNEVNRAYLMRDPSLVTVISHPDCNSCQNIVEDIARLREADTEVAGERFKLDYAETAPFVPSEPVLVDFRYSSDMYREVASDGSVELEAPAKAAQEAQARLLRGASGWLMYGLRVLEP